MSRGVIIAFSLALCLCCGWTDAQYKATAILFRHGQRTPIATLPNLKSDLTTELGYGQLTNTGSRQLYENGILLRLKYFNLFPKDGFFRLSNMKILTSVPERTMMSLQSFMAGFLPPPLTDLTLPIYWQPFFTNVDYQARIVHVEFDNCPKFTANMYQFIANPPANIATWLVEDRPILDQLAVDSGVPLDTLMDVIMLAEVIKAQIYVDPNTPKWAIDGYYNTLKKYMESLFTMYHSTPEMVKIRGGPMITEIVNNMVAVANNDPSGKNFLIYSAHDMTVYSLAYALGVESQIPTLVNYADTIMVDLVANGSGEPNVEVIYFHNENTSRTALDVPGCGTSCSLTTFRNAMGTMMVVDWDALCAM